MMMSLNGYNTAFVDRYTWMLLVATPGLSIAYIRDRQFSCTVGSEVVTNVVQKIVYYIACVVEFFAMPLKAIFYEWYFTRIYYYPSLFERYAVLKSCSQQQNIKLTDEELLQTAKNCYGLSIKDLKKYHIKHLSPGQHNLTYSEVTVHEIGHAVMQKAIKSEAQSITVFPCVPPLQDYVGAVAKYWKALEKPEDQIKTLIAGAVAVKVCTTCAEGKVFSYCSDSRRECIEALETADARSDYTQVKIIIAEIAKKTGRQEVDILDEALKSVWSILAERYKTITIWAGILKEYETLDREDFNELYSVQNPTKAYIAAFREKKDKELITMFNEAIETIKNYKVLKLIAKRHKTARVVQA